MKSALRLMLPIAAALSIAACNAANTGNLPSIAGQTQNMPQWEAKGLAHRACPLTQPGYMHCDVLLENRAAGPNIAGWQPASLESRYNLPWKTKGKGQIVAIVDAYDNPDVASDLAVYRKEFGLSKGTFKKFNQTGQQSNYPSNSPGWGVEIDLDVEMVSASCPNCTIYLIEADDNSGTNLYLAEEEAVKLKAHIISNSWGGGGGSSSGGSFDKPNTLYLASAGDSGYGEQDPADYSTVAAVGGTFLSGSGKSFQEVVWPDSGGGCSVVTKPSWQTDPKCKFRTGNDIAAVAVSAAEYDTDSEGGWITVDGTSISSPLVAGMYGLAGNASKLTGGENLWKLSAKDKKKFFHVIKTGNLSKCPASLGGTYLCNAGTKEYGTYSSPNGWGTPNGISAL